MQSGWFNAVKLRKNIQKNAHILQSAAAWRSGFHSGRSKKKSCPSHKLFKKVLFFEQLACKDSSSSSMGG